MPDSVTSKASRLPDGCKLRHLELVQDEKMSDITPADAVEAEERPPSLRLLKLMLIVSDLDPFGLFKDPEARRRLQHKLGGALPSSLCFNRTKVDKWRTSVARYNRIFHVYLAVKGLLAGTIQFFLLQHELQKGKKTITTGQRRNSRPLPLLNLNFLQTVSSYIGNPMAALSDVSLNVYVSMTGLALVRLIVIPHAYARARYKINMAHVRFVLNPCSEQQRLKAITKQKLCDFEKAVDYFVRTRLAFAENARRNRQEELGTLKVRCGKMTVRTQSDDDDDKISLDSWSAVRKQVCALKCKPRELSSLRLKVFQLAWHESISRQAHLFSYLMLCSVTLIMLGFLAPPLYFNARSYAQCARGATSEQLAQQHALLNSSAPEITALHSSCAPVFTWIDVIFFLELTFCVACCALFESNSSVLCYVNIVCQFKLIKSMSKELLYCKLELLEGYKLLLLQSCIQQTVKLSVTQRDKLLLQKLAKLCVFEAELADNFRALSEQALAYFYHILSMAFVFFITADMQSVLSYNIRNLTIGLFWLWANFIALLCCSMHARLVELERCQLSILALMASIQAETLKRRLLFLETKTTRSRRFQEVIRKKTRARADERRSNINAGPSQFWSTIRTGSGASADDLPGISTLDVIRDLWQRFVLETSGNIEQYCVRPLGIHLTYKSVIELNLMVSFVYSLALNRTTLNRSRND